MPAPPPPSSEEHLLGTACQEHFPLHSLHLLPASRSLQGPGSSFHSGPDSAAPGKRPSGWLPVGPSPSPEDRKLSAPIRSSQRHTHAVSPVPHITQNRLSGKAKAACSSGFRPSISLPVHIMDGAAKAAQAPVGSPFLLSPSGSGLRADLSIRVSKDLFLKGRVRMASIC